VVKCYVSFIGMETGLMFNCDLCSFRSVRKDNYLAHVAEHKNGSYPNNRHRKRNSSKPQVSSAVLWLLLWVMCVCDLSESLELNVKRSWQNLQNLFASCMDFMPAGLDLLL